MELNANLPAARKILADSVRGIWGYVRCQDALDAASMELARAGPWIDGWIGFKQALTYDGAGMSDDVRARLLGIVERLKPTDLLNRARAIVITRSRGGFETLEGEASSPIAAWHLAEQQAVDLGKAFASEPGLLATFLPELYPERASHRAFHFGKGLAAGAADTAELWGTLIDTKMPADGRNVTTLGGYIYGASTSPEFVAAALDGVADDPDVADDLTYLQASTGIDRDGIARLSAALDTGKISAGSFGHLANGRVGGSPGDALAGLLRNLATHPGGSDIALDILHMSFACAKSEGREYDADLIVCGREILATADFEGSTSLADYGVGEVVEVCLTGTDGEETARAVYNRVRDWVDSFTLSAYRIGHLFKVLFAVQPDIALDTFLIGGGRGRNLSLERRFPINDMDVAVLRGWADVDSETRYSLERFPIISDRRRRSPKRLCSCDIRSF